MHTGCEFRRAAAVHALPLRCAPCSSTSIAHAPRTLARRYGYKRVKYVGRAFDFLGYEEPGCTKPGENLMVAFRKPL